MKDKAKFTLGLEDNDEFEGLYDPGSNWNGFANPCFAISEVRKIKSLLDRMADEMPDEDHDRIDIDDRLRVFMCSNYGDRVEIKPTEQINGLKMYPIGSYGWTWQKVTEEPTTTNPAPQATQ